MFLCVSACVHVYVGFVCVVSMGGGGGGGGDRETETDRDRDGARECVRDVGGCFRASFFLSPPPSHGKNSHPHPHPHIYPCFQFFPLSTRLPFLIQKFRIDYLFCIFTADAQRNFNDFQRALGHSDRCVPLRVVERSGHDHLHGSFGHRRNEQLDLALAKT